MSDFYTVLSIPAYKSFTFLQVSSPLSISPEWWTMEDFRVI